MGKEYSVFISSTSDLDAERKEAVRGVLALKCNPVSMENWAATSDPPPERIKEKLAGCEVFILLAGSRYGDLAEGVGVSYVELEYREALALHRKIFVLLKDSNPGDVDKKQSEFRDLLSHRHTNRVWKEESDIASLVMGGLHEIILGCRSTDVFHKNVDLVTHIESYIEQAAAKDDRSLRAAIIQYTSANAVELVRALLWKNAPTHLYVISPKSKHIINRHQRRRLRESLAELPNRLRRPGEDLDESLLAVYGYDAPGSIRAVLIERSTGEGDWTPDFVAVGSYVYMKMNLRKDEKLDIRGGELPGLVLRPKHEGFQVFAKMIHRTIKNWHENHICSPIDLF